MKSQCGWILHWNLRLVIDSNVVNANFLTNVFEERMLNFWVMLNSILLWSAEDLIKKPFSIISKKHILWQNSPLKIWTCSQFIYILSENRSDNMERWGNLRDSHIIWPTVNKNFKTFDASERSSKTIFF